MDVIKSCIAEARRHRRTVVLPEGDDERVIGAAVRLRDKEIADVILLGDARAIARAADDSGRTLDGIRVLDPATHPRIHHYADAFVAGHPKRTVGSAQRRLRKPLFHGGMMVRCGDADAMVAGVANPTARIITAGILTIGAAPGIETPSSYFIMVVPELDRPVIFADCAVNVSPSAAQLADIAIASAASARTLSRVEPRVALISAGDASPSASTVRTAAQFLRERAPELSIDAGVSIEYAVDHGADVLVFPDLETGNIGYKAAQYLAGAAAYGPFLQGFARPISDLSRGATVDDIVKTCAVLLALA